MALMPYRAFVKITLHVDEELLKNVMESTGISSKTGTIDFALRELDRRKTLRRLLESNLGLSDEEIINAFDPAYDLMALREKDTPSGVTTRPDA